MKSSACLLLLTACLAASGCSSTRPVVVGMDNGIQQKTITQCDNDTFCFQKPLYDVAWDSWCRSTCGSNMKDCGKRGLRNLPDYPVSYRSSEYVYANPNGYDVNLPAGGNVLVEDNTKGAANE